MKKLIFSAILAMLVMSIFSCRDSSATDPNELGGSSDVEFTHVGDKTIGSLYFDGVYVNNVKDSIVVTNNSNGIVTTFAQYVFDTTATKAFDTLLGMQGMPNGTKISLLNTYLKKFGAVLDTSNKNAMTLKVQLRSKVTSEGIQDFMYSGGNLSKPFTLVKYASNVGDKYEFTDVDNVKITREVVYKSTTDDYDVAFWKIKVTKVEETKEDPVVQKITYVANHKFGLVGAIVTFKNGKTAKLGFIPPNM